MRRMKLREQLLHQAGLLLISLFVLIPLWSTLRLAFDASLFGAPTQFRWWPREFSIQPFIDTWNQPSQLLSFTGLLRNSLIVAGGAALSSVAFGASMAYAFARFRFPGKQTGLFTLLLGTLLPQVALMTPLYVLLSMLGIRTTLFGLMLVYTAFSMPFCVWNMRASFQAVPIEVEEAAFIEGANLRTTFWRVTLPLALPSIAVAALLAFLVGYTEFAIGWLFVESGDNVTLAMAVSGLLGQGGAYPWSKISALALMMSMPVVILFIFLRRLLLRGVLLGELD